MVTLENLGLAEVPYQIRSCDEIPGDLAELGYDIVDEWVIPSLAHVIPTHPELGRSTSRGYAARLGRVKLSVPPPRRQRSAAGTASPSWQRSSANRAMIG